MTVLVTGCFGFIGYNFLNFLDSKNVNFIGVDSLVSNSSKILYEGYSSKDKIFIFDISDSNQLDKLKTIKIDSIVNFAAETHVDNSIFNPSSFIKSNILGVTELVTFAKKNDISNFVHISTDEVYGSTKDKFFQEDSQFNPSSPYSASKASAELICNSFIKTYDMNIKIVRPSNNYGPFQQPEKLIPFSIANLLNNKSIEIYAKGNQVRHWLHVEDTCSGVFEVLSKGKSGEAYNIGSGEYLKNIEVANSILKSLDLDSSFIDYVADRPGHDFRYAIDFQKIQQLGWTPNKKFDEELPKTINWYKANLNLWEMDYNEIIKKRKKRLGL